MTTEILQSLRVFDDDRVHHTLPDEAGWIESANPANDTVLAAVKLESRATYDEKVTAAQTVQREWRMLPAPKRGEIVRRIGNAMREHEQDLGALVTLECGKVGHRLGTEHATEYLNACLHLSEIPSHPVAPHDVDLYHTVAVVRVPSETSFTFGDDDAAIVFPRDLDTMNFRELPIGTLLAETNGLYGQPLDVRDEQDREVAERFFLRDDDRLVTRMPVMPSMLTCDPMVIRQDCLCYLMERYDDHLEDAG